ncbi:hypothetical protein PRIPAC_91381 [Pristionchus pacificus]|nr:hypothetical protein PRIPAC_90394 [Pristionchus pacificus]KAF8364458.1 hypothetical protein PRIPAC_91381 [Pristionchus pacificus]|eukprot:PDM62181.1 hypothetical protein PRIPAC_51623 [Pristionchus pacificus]
MAVVHLLGIVGLLVVCAGKQKKASEDAKKKETFSSTKSSKTTTASRASSTSVQQPAIPGGDSTKKEDKKSSSKTSSTGQKKLEEFPPCNDFKVPSLTPAEAAKRKHLLEQQRDQRMANGELTRDVDDTLDMVESMRIQEEDDRTPAEHLKTLDWSAGHPDRAKHLLRYEERKRFDEWNAKPHLLHRRYIRHLSVVLTMQTYQCELSKKEPGKAKSAAIVQEWCANWVRETANDFHAAKHAQCPYPHVSSDPIGCGDDHQFEGIMYIKWPKEGHHPKDDRVVTVDYIFSIFLIGQFKYSRVATVFYASFYTLSFVLLDYQFLYRYWAIKSLF